MPTVALGLIMGAVPALFIRFVCGFEAFFERRVDGSYFRQQLAGRFEVGLGLYGLMVTRGHYYIEGVGYSTVQEVLAGNHFTVAFRTLLFGFNLRATSVTLGSGASGGIFSPALFLGATFGSGYGILLGRFFPELGISPPAFAVTGMAGVVGGATGAARSSRAGSAPDQPSPLETGKGHHADKCRAGGCFRPVRRTGPGSHRPKRASSLHRGG